jgi:hypothetical protein
MSILAYNESGSLSHDCKENGRGSTQDCLTITRAKLYEAVRRGVVDQIVEAKILSTMEFEAKIILDLFKQFTLFRWLIHNLPTVTKHTGVLTIHLAEEAYYLVGPILVHCFQFFGHVQLHLKCSHITSQAIINEFRVIPNLHLNLYCY